MKFIRHYIKIITIKTNLEININQNNNKYKRKKYKQYNHMIIMIQKTSFSVRSK